MKDKLFEAMKKEGLAPKRREALVADGDMHRYQIDGDRPNIKNGAYQVIPEENMAWFMTFREQKKHIVTFSVESPEG